MQYKNSDTSWKSGKNDADAREGDVGVNGGRCGEQGERQVKQSHCTDSVLSRKFFFCHRLNQLCRERPRDIDFSLWFFAGIYERDLLKVEKFDVIF
jgi:hypothetical protein